MFPYFSCLAREAKMPKTDNIEKTTKPVFIAEIRPLYVDGFIVCLPMYNEISIIAIPILIIWPIIRIVPTTPEATPK